MDEACCEDVVHRISLMADDPQLMVKQVISQLKHEKTDGSSPPLEVYSSIERILKEFGVEEHQIRRNFNNPSEIIVYQHGAKNHEQLKSKLSSMPDCNSFKINTFEFSLQSLCSSHLSPDTVPGDVSSRHVLPYLVERDRRPMGTVGLVLQRQDHEWGNEYFGISTAHVVLEEGERETLFLDNVLNSGHHKRISERVESDFAEHSWSLRAHNDSGIRITEKPIFSYGKYYRNPLSKEDLNWFRAFYHDVILFKLNKDDLEGKGLCDQHPDKGTKWLQIHTSPFSHAHNPEFMHSNIIGILQVEDSWDIELLEQARVNVVVGNTTGFLVPSPRTAKVFPKVKQGLHICFMTNSSLWPGQSGSIVYVIKKETRELLVLGMLMGLQFKWPNDESPPVYECTVMWPAIHQMEHENPGMIAELGMVHYDTKETAAEKEDKEQSGNTSRTPRLGGPASDDVQTSIIPGDHSDMEGNDCKRARYSSENDSQPQEIQRSHVKDCSGDASVEQETDSENITDHSGAEHAHGESSAIENKDKPDGVTAADDGYSDDTGHTLPLTVDDSQRIFELISQLKHERDYESIQHADPPEKVYRGIESILKEFCVKEYQIRRNSDNPSEITVYQRGAKNHEQLKSKLSSMPDCQMLTINTFEFPIQSRCSSHLSPGTVPADHILPFILERYVDEGTALPKATVGLVLKEQEIGGYCKSDFEYYGVTTVHAIFEAGECDLLRFDCIDSDQYPQILERIASEFRDNQWRLRANNEGSIPITGKPIFSYGVKSSGKDWFRMFYHDIVVFKLNKEILERKGWIDQHPVKRTRRLQVHTSPFSHVHNPEFTHSNITGILKVTESSHIAQLGKVRANIVVANTTGFIVESPYPEQCNGLHICFRANSRLLPGHSGSIVYVIKNDGSNDLMVLGMVMGQQPMNLNDENPIVYECTVMWPGIHQVVHDNPGTTAELDMVDYNQDIVHLKDLKAIKPENGEVLEQQVKEEKSD